MNLLCTALGNCRKWMDSLFRFLEGVSDSPISLEYPSKYEQGYVEPRSLGTWPLRFVQIEVSCHATMDVALGSFVGDCAMRSAHIDTTDMGYKPRTEDSTLSGAVHGAWCYASYCTAAVE